MVNISKKKLPENILRRIDNQLLAVIGSQNKKGLRKLLDEFFTEAEKIMLVKRMAIIAMLHEKCTYYEISKTLSVSTATVKVYHSKILHGEFQFVSTYFKKEERKKEFWETLEVLLGAGLPPRGRGRWSSTLKLLRK